MIGLLSKESEHYTLKTNSLTKFWSRVYQMSPAALVLHYVSRLFGVREVSTIMRLGKTTDKEIYKRSIADSEKYNVENLKQVAVLGDSSFRVGS